MNSQLFWGYKMYAEIDNPTDYKVALYIRLSKEDDTEDDKKDDNRSESQSIINQRSMFKNSVKNHKFNIFIVKWAILN